MTKSLLEENFFRLLNSPDEANVAIALELAKNLSSDSDGRKAIQGYQLLCNFLDNIKKFDAKAIVNLRHREMVLMHNKNIKSIPPSIQLMEDLKILDLSNCSLEKLPDEIIFLQNLEELFLRHNKFSQFPMQICKLKNLKHLFLNYNNFNTIPKEIKQLSNLKTFHFQQAKVVSDNHQQQIESWLSPNCEVFF